MANATKQEKPSLLDNENFLGGLLLAPAVVYILLLVGIPFALAIVYAFTDVTVGDQSLDFVGFDTFERVLDDPKFEAALTNNLGFTAIAQPLIIVLSLILALVLSQDFPLKWLFRFLILLPWVTPIALSTVGWLWMLDNVHTPLDWALRELGLLGPGKYWGPRPNMYWMGKDNLARGMVIAIHVWRMLPLTTVIILAGLTSIPQDIKDAVAVDGAGFFLDLFDVKLPLLFPITAVATLFGLIFTFTDMTIVWVLTKGGPVDSTHVLAEWAYLKGIVGTDLAGGAATAIFMFPVLLAVAILVLTFVNRAEVS